jgi:hypothetical protein
MRMVQQVANGSITMDHCLLWGNGGVLGCGIDLADSATPTGFAAYPAGRRLKARTRPPGRRHVRHPAWNHRGAVDCACSGLSFVDPDEITMITP